jgi:hypothetical protein
MEWINEKKPGLGFRGFVAGEVTGPLEKELG